MTKKLEELLNLPENKQVIKDAEDQTAKDESNKKRRELYNKKKNMRDFEELDKITAALPQVSGLGDLGDKELNEISEKALQSYEDLMDLGMNLESRYSGRVFEVANSMLKTSLDARVAKLDKKLKMVDLQLKKEKQDKEAPKDGSGDVVNGEGYVVTDRNSLLERLKGMDKDK